MAPSPTGAIQVATQSTGTSLDPDGYSYSMDGGAGVAIATTATVTITAIAPGNHTLRLNGVATNCSLAGTNPRTVAVVAHDTTTELFTVTCTTPPPPPGSIHITTATTGLTQDQDGYAFSIDQLGSAPIGTNGSVTLPGLAPGSHSVALSHLDANCQVVGLASVNVTVASGATASVQFNVACTPTLKNRVVFASTRTLPGGLDDLELWATNPDGSFPIRLTTNSLQDVGPSVSPDGSKVTFTRGPFQGPRHVYTAAADGSNSVELTSGTFDMSPAWSPDGGTIVFAQVQPNTTVTDLVLMNADGSNQHILGDTTSTRTTRRQSPTWSPDGLRLAFSTDTSINVMNVNGTGEAVVVHGPGQTPNWSAVGDRIVFTMTQEVWVVHPDGSGLVQITTDGAQVFRSSPTWDPSGTKILTSHSFNGSGVSEIWVMNDDGSHEHLVSTGGNFNLTPTWR